MLSNVSATDIIEAGITEVPWLKVTLPAADVTTDPAPTEAGVTVVER